MPSTTSAAMTRTAPIMRIRKAAGPSPTLKLEKSSPQARHLGANPTQLLNKPCAPQRGQLPRSAAPSGCGSVTDALSVDRRAPAAPHVDRGEQEQPHDVDEMPVPGRRF